MVFTLVVFVRNIKLVKSLCGILWVVKAYVYYKRAFKSVNKVFSFLNKPDFCIFLYTNCSLPMVLSFTPFYIPPHDSGGVLWYHVGCWCVRPSIHLSYIRPYFCFWTIPWVNVSGFSPNSAFALILYRSDLGLLPDDNFSKYELIFTQLGVYVDIVKT